MSIVCAWDCDKPARHRRIVARLSSLLVLTSDLRFSHSRKVSRLENGFAIGRFSRVSRDRPPIDPRSHPKEKTYCKTGKENCARSSDSGSKRFIRPKRKISAPLGAFE